VKEMEERRNNNLDGMVKRAMDDDRPSDHTRQFEAPKYEETQYRTRTRSGETGSVGKSGSQSAVGSQRSAVDEGQTITRQTDRQAGNRKSSGKKSRSTFFKGLISGTVISDSIILKDVKYTAMIVLLAIIFIANRFNAERVEREISALEQEVRDLRAESLSVSADLGSVSRQSEISDLVKERGLGLEELREPPYRIVVNE